MSATTPALIAAAAGVGFGHAILPDHWVPLSVLGRTRRYPIGRVARLSGLAGMTHVLVSVVLGALVVAVGLQFRATVEHAQDTIVGAVLVATGVAFVGLQTRGHGHAHDHRGRVHGSSAGHRHRPRGRGRWHDLAAVMVPLGAAASPDLTILPVFLAAAAVGTGAAIGSLLAFAGVTVGTIVALTVIATLAGYRLRGRWLDRWGNAITAAALLVIGTLVLTGAI